jgi:two-component system, OmpR family, response regulator QseB
VRILLLEDQVGISKPVRRILEAQGYNVVLVETLAEARLGILESEFDLYILDVRLPDSAEGGFILAKEIRAAGFRGRILIMTARDALADRVMGLDLGADDYVVKPFELPELMARVRALLRRDSSVISNVLTRGRLTFEFTQRQALWDGVAVALTQRELSLLERVVLNADRTVSAEELTDAIWGENALPGVVKVMVYQIRNKIATDVIATQSGRGYRLGACLGTP